MPIDSHHVTCPFCESGELRPAGSSLVRCDQCECVLGGEFLEVLHEILALPDALGRHACECGHPEMRQLPGGVFWCPACRSEVTPHVA